jgi:hypothetical protein
LQIDTLVMVLADQNGGKSNQMRSIFEEPELHSVFGGYPHQRNIPNRYLVGPDIELYVRLTSWHEANHGYATVRSDIINNRRDPKRRYKVFLPAQVTGTAKLVAGQQLFMRIVADFDIRRAYAVWLNPDRSSQTPFGIDPGFASWMSVHREASAMAIDGLALHPSASPAVNSINARFLTDLLFRA